MNDNNNTQASRGKVDMYCFKNRMLDQRADTRSKKNYNPAAWGSKTTFTER